MNAPVRPHYATKAKVEHAIRMARLAGIEKIGAIEFGPDGSIRISAEPRAPVPQAQSVEDEIARWRAKRGK
jgi:hypothetical protein